MNVYYTLFSYISYIVIENAQNCLCLDDEYHKLQSLFNYQHNSNIPFFVSSDPNIALTNATCTILSTKSQSLHFFNLVTLSHCFIVSTRPQPVPGQSL